MSLLTRARAVIAGAERISPDLAAAIALRLFFLVAPRMTMSEQQGTVIARATPGRIRGRVGELVTYEWDGEGETVLLVHGWRGRAAQFGGIVDALLDAGYRVVAFDAPAHGSSPGRRTDVRDWVDAIEQLSESHGPFRAIVGHSFGAFATITAVRHGVQTDAIVTIAGAGRASDFIDQYAGTMALSSRVKRAFVRRFHRRLGETAASSEERYDAVAHPLAGGPPILALHDADDRALSVAASEALVDAHESHARLVRTRGLGHRRILSERACVDQIVEFVGAASAAAVD